MKQAEDDQKNLMQKFTELYNIVREDRRNYDEDIRRRDREIEALRKEIEELTLEKEYFELAPSVPDVPSPSDSVPTPNDDVQRSDVLAPGKQRLENRRADETARHEDTMKEMRQTLIEMILLRAEVAQLYKEWPSMASLAATALAESSILMSGHYMARSCFYHGVALYKLGLYWEASTTFENSRNHAETQEDRVEVESWLEKTKEAQTAAQSALSRQSSVFEPSPTTKPRTDSIPVVSAPTALNDELDFDSDFDSVRGFGSRTPSVQSVLASAVESPQERQPRSAERGPEVRDPRSRESSLNRRTPGRQMMYSPMRRTPDTPRIPSPLMPQRTLTDIPASESNKQRLTPSRTASTGTKPLDKPRIFADQFGEAFSKQNRLLPSSPLARPPVTNHHDSIGNNRNRSGSESLRHSTLLRNATTADARRHPQLRGIEARIEAAAPRRHSALTREMKLSNEAGLNTVDKASKASGDHVRDETRPESKKDMQAELDGLLSESRSDERKKITQKPSIQTSFNPDAKQLADRLQAIVDQQEESISPGTVAAAEPVSGDRFPLPGSDNHAEKNATSPVQSGHHSGEEEPQVAEENKILNGATGEQRDRSGLQGEVEEDGEAILQEVRELNGENTEPGAGTTEQAPTNSLSSHAGDQNTIVAGAPVKKGSPDDLYDVEDDYVAPTLGPASSVISPATEPEKDLGDENVEWEIVPPLNMAEGAFSQGIGIDMLQGREQDAKIPAERLDEEEVTEEDNAELLLVGADGEEPAGQEGVINESKETSEAKKDEEETNERRESSGSLMSGEGKGNNSKKTKRRKKKGKR